MVNSVIDVNLSFKSHLRFTLTEWGMYNLLGILESTQAKSFKIERDVCQHESIVISKQSQVTLIRYMVNSMSNTILG